MNPTRDAAITPYDRLAWSDDEIEALLASGERRRELIAMFGTESYLELAALARTALAVAAAAGPRVWLVPGIMGSRLGRKRANGEPADTIWLDPYDIIAGRLTELHAATESGIESLGILHFSYLSLKFRLAAAGYSVRSVDYDWRSGVLTLGEQFANALRRDGRDCMIVAHSMGGLVARAALLHAALPKLQRLLLVGTPNGGSWAAVQALRGTYSVVRRLSQLDLQHSAKSLTTQVFSSFQSLYDLLPGVARGEHRLLDCDNWPQHGLQPEPQRLRAAAAAARSLLAADERCVCIVGEGEATVVGAQIAEQITYHISRAGDGTVASAAARLSGALCYFSRCSHSQLTRSPRVAEAIVELLRTGKTALLSSREHATDESWLITEQQLTQLPHQKLDWAALSADERRVFLDTLNEALPSPLSQQPAIM